MVQLTPLLVISNNIVSGYQYRFRYRALNFNGWGPLSEIGYYLAANSPNAPPTPIYIGSSPSLINLQFLPPLNNGGSVVTGYKLYYDEISIPDNYALVYSGNLMSVSVGLTNGLVMGTIYRFTLVASNQFGDSGMSQELRAALGSLPLTPNAPFKIEN